MQRTLRFQSLEPGGVNRAYEVHVTAAGKAVNAAQTVAALGGEALLATFLGGDPGRFISRELEAGGVPQEVIWTEDDAPTRVCTTLLPDDGPVTELVEEAHPVSEGDIAALEEAVTRRLREAEFLCLMGSFPPGVPDDFYARLSRTAREAGVRVLVDAKGASLRAALAALTEAGAQWALVSTGETGSLLGDGSGSLWRVESPSVEAQNPIGSGDVMAAGLPLPPR